MYSSHPPEAVQYSRDRYSLEGELLFSGSEKYRVDSSEETEYSRVAPPEFPMERVWEDVSSEDRSSSIEEGEKVTAGGFEALKSI